jgi:tetratricopeptide (TPR) repeat protein
MVFGPTPADESIAALQHQVDRAKGAKWAFGAFRGMSRLRALQGRFPEARELNARARATFEDLGDRIQIADSLGDAGEIEYRAGNLAEAARLTREAYEAMVATGDRSFASTYAAFHGEVLLELGEDDEALRFGSIARDWSATDDVASQATGRAVQARVLSRRGDHDGAEVLAREAEAITAATDFLPQHGDMLVHLAHVLREGGKAEEAVAAARQAVALYDQKGATFLVDRTQRLIDEWIA